LDYTIHKSFFVSGIHDSNWTIHKLKIDILDKSKVKNDICIVQSGS